MTTEPQQADYVTRMVDKQRERIDEFAKHGIAASSGPYLGCITLSAGNTDKVLRLLRRLARKEAQ